MKSGFMTDLEVRDLFLRTLAKNFGHRYVPHGEVPGFSLQG
jgi:hypothetical protein